ncbi:MAG: glycosyltransferase family 4 protein [Oligoflexales bacterium]|nr:glycosyltransferase family 4 protein [Oligoflexales bacterium]
MIRKPIRFDQLLPTYMKYDAIGTHVSLIQKLLRERGFESEIFAERFPAGVDCRDVNQYSDRTSKDSALIYHYSTGSNIVHNLLQQKGFRVVDYHNITPAKYLMEPEEWNAHWICKLGRLQMPLVRIAADVCWADSGYNAGELREANFPECMVLPVLRDYERLGSFKDVDSLAFQMKDGRKNILFVGRIAANKGFHDILFLFKLYKQHIDNDVRLIFVGTPSPVYQRKIQRLIRELGLSWGTSVKKGGETVDVVMPGAVRDEELATYYRHSHLFLCASDHEGFCVPLVEAMFFEVPIIAHISSAVPETCEDAALLVDKSDEVSVLEKMRAILKSPELSGELKLKARKRSEYFKWDFLVRIFDGCLEKTLKVYSEWY